MCWFLDRQVVPLCPGGLQESRGHVSTLHGWQKHTHTLTHTHTACVLGIHIMTVKNTCGVLPSGSNPTCVWVRHKHTSIDCSTFSIRRPGTSHLSTHTHTDGLTHRISTSGKLVVIIGKSFEGCRYSDGEDAGLLNVACKTHLAWQHSTHSPRLNDLVN